MKKTIATAAAPGAIGPYSQAVVYNGIVFASGQIPLDPATGKMVEGDISSQTERVLENLKAVLGAAGASLDSALKITVYLKDMNDFSKMNEVCGRYFPANPPARATIQAAQLPRGAAVEIDAIAAVER
jgi:2-iminobutanoate/2-iminopropanoate deaminase